MFFSIINEQYVRNERKAKERINLPVTFKVKFLVEHTILYIIFNMTTSNINKMNIVQQKKKKHFVATALKKIDKLSSVIDFSPALPYFSKS